MIAQIARASHGLRSRIEVRRHKGEKIPQRNRDEAGQQPTSDWGKEHSSNERAAHADLELGEAQQLEGAHTAAIGTYTTALQSGNLKSLPHDEARALFSQAESYGALNNADPPSGI